MEPTKSSNLLEAAMRECGLMDEQTEEETGPFSAGLHSSSPSIILNSSMQNASMHGQAVIPNQGRHSVVVYQSHPNSNVQNPNSSISRQVPVQGGVTKNMQAENAPSGNVLLGLNNVNQLGGRQTRIVSVARLPSVANAPGVKRMVPLTIASPGAIPTTFGKAVTLVSGTGTQIVALPRAASTGVTSTTGVKPPIQSPLQTFQQFPSNVGPIRTQLTAVRMPAAAPGASAVNRVALQPQFTVRKMQPVQVSVSMQNRLQVPPGLIGPTAVQRIPTAGGGNVGVLSQMLRPSSPAPGSSGVIRIASNVSSSSTSHFVQLSNPTRPSVVRLAPNVLTSSTAFSQPSPMTCLGARQTMASRLVADSGSSVLATLAGKRIIRLAPVQGTASPSQTIVQSRVSDGLALQTSNKDVSFLRQGSSLGHSGVSNFKTNSSPNLTTALHRVQPPIPSPLQTFQQFQSNVGPIRTQVTAVRMPAAAPGASAVNRVALQTTSLTTNMATSATSSENNIAVSANAGTGSDETVSEQTDSSPSQVTFNLSDEEDEDDPNDFMAALRQLRDNNKKVEEIEATRRAKQLSEVEVPSSSASKLTATAVTLPHSNTSTSLMYGQQTDAQQQAEHLSMRSSNNSSPSMFSLLGTNSHQRLTSAVQTTSFSNLGVRNLAIFNPSSKSVYDSRTSAGSPVGTSTLRLSAPRLLPGGRAFTSQGMGALSSFSSPPAFIVDKVTGKVWVNDVSNQGKFLSQGMFLPTTRGQQSAPGGYLDLSAVEPEVEEEELGHAETYADYKPAKLSIGRRHPDPTVESSSLSSVEPPDVEYVLNLPKDTINEGKLSSLQLETITYACQKHETYLPNKQRVGYLVGDGAGVGKGRTIAGIIFENFRCGRKRALWLSVSNDLLEDARRDLNDVGAHDIDLHALNKFKYAKISSTINQKVKRGVIFATYSSLIGESQKQGKYSTRMKQILRWLGKEFEGLIIFDECHRAKNLVPNGSSKATKTGQKVVELQNNLPNARIVYASATGASEPQNMAYMVRLGLWGIGTPFEKFDHFHDAIKKRGVGAMELVAMEMKQRGTYIARQLSFQGVSFKIAEVNISDRFVKLYNDCVRLWVKTREYFQEALRLVGDTLMSKKAWGQYWSTHQRFFKYICISSKVAYAVELSLEAVEKGKSVVIGLQSTGEAKTLEQLESHGWELTEFVSTAKGVFQKMIEAHFPNPDSSSETSSGCDEMSSQPLRAKEGRGRGKRKMGASAYQRSSKRPKLDAAGCSDIESKKSSESESTEEEDEEEVDSLEVSEVEGDEDEEEEEDVARGGGGWGSESDDDDDTNPFAKASGSDDDSDPWIRKPKKRQRELEPKKTEKKTEKKPEKKTKRKRNKPNSSDEEFGDDFEEQAAKAVTFLSQKESIVGNQSKSISHNRSSDNMSYRDQIAVMKRELLEDIEVLGPRLPSNTLDELIEKLGGKDAVAEMTGRKGRMIMTNSGIIQYESRGEADATLENINNTERQRFMEGVKRIAIISEAASSGISLHADRRARNQTRRVHITLELPWSADRAIQQFGRTHRSNQVNSPEYIFLISELAGERRFAATVAKRLESLGALTHGDRRATETRDLSQFNIDNKYGQKALGSVLKFVLYNEKPLVKVPDDYNGDFCSDVRRALEGVGLDGGICGGFNRDKDQSHINKFLNRILGMEVAVQNALFQYFTSTLEEVILMARREGEWDLGILDLGSSGEHVLEKEMREFSGLFSGFQTKVRLTTVIVERGIDWSLATKMLDESTAEGSGFYRNKHQQGYRTLHVLALGRKKNVYKIYKPSVGITSTLLTAEDLKSKYVKVTDREIAKRHWDEQYEGSATLCQHQYQFRQCRTKNCEIGRRTRLYHILSGSVLSVWTSVETVIRDACNIKDAKMQVIRVRTTTGKRIVGTLIPPAAAEPLSKFFKDTELSKTKPQGRTASANHLTNLINNSL